MKEERRSKLGEEKICENKMEEKKVRAGTRRRKEEENSSEGWPGFGSHRCLGECPAGVPQESRRSRAGLVHQRRGLGR